MEATLVVSTRTVATLLARLCRKAQTPVALAAERYERAFRRVFFQAVKDAQGAVPLAELIDVLSLGHPGSGGVLYVLQPVIDLLLAKTDLPREHLPYSKVHVLKAKDETLTDVYARVLKAGADAVPLDIAFDATNPEAVEWARTRAAKLVTDVTIEVKAAIRTLVADGFENGVAPRATAKVIRASIGLTERDAGAVMKRQIQLLADGVDTDVATRKAEAYAAKLTRSRANTIARTETMKAANEGQMQLWQQAREKGLLTGRERKVWITADPCDICAELEGETVDIDEDFSIGDDPPAHPNCRCTIGLVSE